MKMEEKSTRSTTAAMIENSEIVLNSINHCLIAATTFYLTWYCFQAKFQNILTQHAFITTLGYQLLMAEGIMALYNQNSFTIRLDRRQQKTMIHWILLAFGCGLAFGGMFIEYIDKSERGRKHFQSRHALWGE